jgi:hypothetical protein
MAGNDSGQQANNDQDRHDRWLEQQTPQDLKSIAKRLTALARSKKAGESAPSSPEQ